MKPGLYLSSMVVTLSISRAVVSMESLFLPLEDHTVVDLSHSYNEHTLFWPTSPTIFELESLSFGFTDDGYFYSANTFSSPEHGGTHLDAPIHFAEHGWAVDEIPLDRLMGPAVVIDVSENAKFNRDYRLSVDDILGFEKQYGDIKTGTIVLLRTDYSQYWPNALLYLGDDTPGDASNLHFPGFGEDAVRLLVEQRKVNVLGVDTASIDYGASSDFIVHQIVGRHSVVGFENLTNLDKLPPVGATVIALPMKIEGGSGGPLRAIAFLPKQLE